MAYFSQTTPDFPVISSQVTIPSVTVEVESVSTGTFFSRTIAPGDYWGYDNVYSGTAGTYVNSSNSLLGTLANQVTDILTVDFGLAGLNVFSQQDWVLGPPHAIRSRFFVVGGGLPSDFIVRVLSEAETFGLTPAVGTGIGSFTISSITLQGLTDFNAAGYFAPYNLTVLDDRRFTREVYQRESSFATPISTNVWGITKTRRVISFPFVYASYCFNYRRELTEFSTPASTFTIDPNNTLQAYLENVADGRQSRIYQDNATPTTSGGQYREGVYVGEGLQDTANVTEDVSGNGQLFSVSLEFVDQGSIGGAT